MAEGFFFQSGPSRLYGFRYDVPEGVPKRDLGVVLVHPFMEERQDSHPVFRNLALALAAKGFPTLRFDLTGAGDSESAWEDGTLPRWLDDIARASEVLRESTGTRRLGLLGLRLGGTLAALAARDLKPEKLCLWQPVIKGQQYATDLLRAHLSSEMVLHKRAGITREVLIERLARGERVNLFGYQLTAAQYDAIGAIDLTTDLAGYDGRVLLVDVVRTPQARGAPELSKLAEGLGPSVTLARAVETQSLFTEGKLHYTTAHEATNVTLAWMESD